MKDVLSSEEYAALADWQKQYYERDGDLYRLRQDRAEELLLLLLLLLFWNGRNYEDASGAVLTATELRNRMRLVTKRYGRAVYLDAKTIIERGGDLTKFISDNADKLETLHKRAFRMRIRQSLAKQAQEANTDLLISIAAIERRVVGRAVRNWRGLAEAISDGKKVTAGQIGSQARGVYTSYAAGESIAAFVEGKTEERRILGFAEHCPNCVDAASLGWEPIGTLPIIGDSVCRWNCRCYFEYR